MAIGRPSVGAKPPLVTPPISGAVGVEDLGAFAGRRAFDQQADADARRRRRRSSREDARGAGKIGRLAAALGDGKGETRLDRRRRLVEVVAVERQARFEAKRIAGAETDRLHPRVGEEPRSRTRRRRSAGTRISKPSSPV